MTKKDENDSVIGNDEWLESMSKNLQGMEEKERIQTLHNKNEELYRMKMQMIWKGFLLLLVSFLISLVIRIIKRLILLSKKRIKIVNNK
ncbi:MAG TPA: hypothetical protein VN854_00015 [Mycoplasmatales bacterium]|jgi:hypothetical protein|nr:hypothetical protein [Mycoplasmatales bacterium]